MPAAALDEAGVQVAAAYLVFLSLVVIYVVIIGLKLRRTESQLEDLAARVPEDDHR